MTSGENWGKVEELELYNVSVFTVNKFFSEGFFPEGMKGLKVVGNGLTEDFCSWLWENLEKKSCLERMEIVKVYGPVEKSVSKSWCQWEAGRSESMVFERVQVQS